MLVAVEVSEVPLAEPLEGGDEPLAADVVPLEEAPADAFFIPQTKLWQKSRPARLLAEALTHCPFQLSHSRDGRV